MNKSAGHVNRKFVILALGLVGLSVSCTEDPLALGSDTAPGAPSEIRDVTLEVTSLPLCRDTSVSGFALPSIAPFMFLSNDSQMLAKGLARFNVPDTLRTLADTFTMNDNRMAN